MPEIERTENKSVADAVMKEHPDLIQLQVWQTFIKGIMFEEHIYDMEADSIY